MNPVAVVAVPVSALVLAGTTASLLPAAVASPPRAAGVASSAPVGPLPPAAAVASSAAAVGPLPRPSGVASTRPELGTARRRAGGVLASEDRSRAMTWTGLTPTGLAWPAALRDRWAWPLHPLPAVVRPFVRPATQYGVGHRGVDLAGAPGQDVLAVAEGTVTHVGKVAGRGTVTVLHSSGIRSTYEPVSGVVVTGATVGRGAVLGILEESGSHCAAATCLHVGAVRGESYLDPLTLLLGGQRVRLLPLGQAPEG